MITLNFNGDLIKYHEINIQFLIGELDIDKETLVHDLPKEFLSMAIGSKLIDDRFKNIPEQ